MRKTATNKNIHPRPSSPSWSLAEIGRRVAALEEIHDNADKLLCAGDPTPDTLREHQKASCVRDFAYDRLESLRRVALTMRAETIADAVVQGLLALDQIKRVEGSELTAYEEALVYRDVHRVLLSITAVMVRAAEIDLGHLFKDRSPPFAWELASMFPSEARP